MVVTLQQQGIICTSDVRSVNGTAGIDYGGSGKGPARARSHGSTGWDDDEGTGDEWE